MCRLMIKGRFFNFNIINVHSPHSGSTDDDKDAFYAQLERKYDCCPSHDVKIIIGDLNAQVGQEEEFRPTIGRFSAHQLTNENGLRLIDFAASKNMAIRSTFFQHSLPYRYTWRSPQQTESQIDYVLIDGRHFSEIIDVRTYRGANVDSDHYLVMVKLRPKLSVINNARYQLPPRYNIERLKQPDVASTYAQNLETALPDKGELDVAPLEDCCSTVKAATNNATECTVGYVERSRRNKWFDEECRVILEEKNAARTVMLQHGTRQNVERYKQKRKEQTRIFREKKHHLEEAECEEMELLYRSQETRKFYKKLQHGTQQNVERYKQKRKEQTRIFREKKRHLEEAECEEMELLYRSQETRKFYKKLNKSRNGPMPRTEMCRDKDGGLSTDGREVIKRWKQHFDEQLNGAENVGMGVQDDGRNNNVSVADDGNDPAPTLREVKDVMHQLKTNRAAGKDGITAELIKMSPERLATCLHRLIVRIWETEQLPEEWKAGVICPIHKKCDHSECENFRANTILNAAYEVLSRIIFRRLSPKTNEFVGSYQADFVDGRSTKDQIFTVQQILQKGREYQVPTHHLFIDFKAAYNSIDRIELWKIMDENSLPGKLTRIIKATMDGVQNWLKDLG
ncbi:uncharacterized protein LOC131429161 [Malaya genurostris]|uniref:uncharacterized protein LOC131429161 n=1 Tax=Malaya genurostris TaxID=325434 RepID=UPI0026F3F481|nr:uncharacterized protein LOC131429161 [Malaya genurostris]